MSELLSGGRNEGGFLKGVCGGQGVKLCYGLTPGEIVAGLSPSYDQTELQPWVVFGPPYRPYWGYPLR